MATIKNKEATIFYTDDGAGQSLVFIHGLGADHTMFEPQVAHFKNNYRVICPDMRGCGQSSELTGLVDTVLDRQCDDIAALLDKAGVNKAVFCGTSYGGVFCMHFALRYPDKVTKLVIADSFSDAKIHNVKEALLLFGQNATLWLMYFPKLLVPAVKSQYKKWPLAQKIMVKAFAKLRSKETILQRKAINKANHTPELNKIACPVLGLVGSDMPILIRYMERVVAHLPNASLTIIQNAQDPSNLCQPKKYNQLVDDFLNK